MRHFAVLCAAMVALMVIPIFIGTLDLRQDDQEGGEAQAPGCRDVREDYYLSGEDRKPVLGKGMKEVGKITLHDMSYLYVPESSLVKIMEDVDLYDNATFDIYAKKIEVHANITMHGGSQLRIHTVQDTGYFLIDGNVTAYNDSKIDVYGIDITFTQRIHLYGNNTLNMSSVNAELRGAMALRFYSRWTVSDGSNITWNPNTDLGQYEPLLDLVGVTNFTLDDSKIYINPPNWTNDPDPELRYNTSYLMTQDVSCVFINRSYFSCILPGNVIEEFKRVPSGAILATGNSKWTFLESTVYGEMNYTQYLEVPVVIDNMSTTQLSIINHDIVPGPGNTSYVRFTRWFWFASQMDGSVSIIRCPEMRLAEPGQTFFKPTSGSFAVKDSKLFGEVRAEAITLLDIDNSEFSYTYTQKGRKEQGLDFAIKIDDRSHGRITNSKFFGNVELGWSSRNDYLGLSQVWAYWEGNVLNGNLSCFANTVLTLKNNQLNYELFEVEGNTTLRLEDQNLSTIDTTEGINERLKLIKENITLEATRSRIQAFQSETENATIEINLRNGSSIGFVNIATPNNTAQIRLENGSKIDEIYSSDDTRIFTTYVNPKEGEVPPSFDPPQNVSVNYVMRAKVYLNDTALSNATVRLTAQGLNSTLQSDENGIILLEYTYRTMTPEKNETLLGENGNCYVEYFALAQDQAIVIDRSNDLTFIFYDRDAPTIIKVDNDAGLGTWALRRNIFFTATITDRGVQGLAKVVFQYRVDGGGWKNLSMTQTRPSHYECNLPRQGMGTIEYRVVTWDQVGNKAISRSQTLESGQQEKWIMIGVGSAATLLLMAFIVVKVKDQMTINRYLNNEFNRDPYPNLRPPKEDER